MANVSLILGESGTGKSTSIRNLDPSATFIINVLNKPLPFKGARSQYKIVAADGLSGNCYASKNYDHIKLVLNKINKVRPEIKTIIVDDFQYLMASEFMSYALEKGYDKFSRLAKNAYDLLEMLPGLREDVDVFVLSHSEANESGKMKAKTIGKMLDDKITIEGLFSVVLHTEVSDIGYQFITQADATHIAKSPMEMFLTTRIPNDLSLVKTKMAEYLNEDVPQ